MKSVDFDVERRTGRYQLTPSGVYYGSGGLG